MLKLPMPSSLPLPVPSVWPRRLRRTVRQRRCLNIANGLTKSKQYTGALTYAEKAIGYNEELKGKSYLKQANVYTILGQYNKAIEFCTLASNEDITVSGSADRLKQNIQKVQANQAANERARKAYDDFIKKQKAEEAFWMNGVK